MSQITSEDQKRAVIVTTMSSMMEGQISSNFQPLKKNFEIFYLDTCVWGTVIKSEKQLRDFAAFFQEKDRMAAVSIFGLFELSRSGDLTRVFSELFSKVQDRVVITSLYDDVVEGELSSFPNVWQMRWMPINLLFDEHNPEPFLKLFEHAGFSSNRDAHYQFGLDRFMNLEEFKSNFPPLHGKIYTPDDVPYFSWAVGIDYFFRHFPQFARKNWPIIETKDIFAFDSVLSVTMRSWFLFYKYYLHEQTPNESDFFDFAHVSYAPYCSVYVTERNVCNVLNRIKKSGNLLKTTAIMHVSDFVRKIER